MADDRLSEKFDALSDKAKESATKLKASMIPYSDGIAPRRFPVVNVRCPRTTWSPHGTHNVTRWADINRPRLPARTRGRSAPTTGATYTR